MRLEFREKSEILYMGENSLRETRDLSFFIFEFIALNFSKYAKIAKGGDNAADLFDEFCSETLNVGETFFILLWVEIEGDLGVGDFPVPDGIVKRLKNFRWIFANRAHDYSGRSPDEWKKLGDIFEKLEIIRSAFETACLFCLDRDMILHSRYNMTAAHKWHIYERLQGSENPREIISKYCDVSERTEVVAEEPEKQPPAYDDKSLEYYDFFGDHINAGIYVASANKSVYVVRVFESGSIYGLIFAEFWNMVINDVSLKTCAYCQKYFMPFSGSSEYCNRIIPGKNKTCKEYAPMYFHRKRNDFNELQKIYKKADSAHYMRHKRNSRHYTWEQFTAWRTKAARLLQMAENGLMNEDEFKLAIKPNLIEDV
jgi:hypothetical protein